MRIPIPALLAALVVAAAASLVVTVKPKQDYYVINATALKPGEKMTVKLDFVPYKVYLIGNSSAWYCVDLYVTNALVVKGEQVPRGGRCALGN